MRFGFTCCIIKEKEKAARLYKYKYSKEMWSCQDKAKKLFERKGNTVDKKAMQEIAREVQREYQREWRKKNPDKVREKNRRYWEKKAQERLRMEAE